MKPDVPVIQWQGCYAESWNGWIVPEAFSHPAKFARGLIRRILEHGIERGYWQPGQLLGDPFGGVACGGIVASSLGLRWVGNELEAKFVAIGKQNIELHRDWYAIGKPRPVLLQGDSRRFHEIIGQAFADGALTSPPYADSLRRQEDGIDWEKCKYEPGSGLHQGRGDSLHATYGDDPAQIAKLRKGGLDAAVTSPPFTTDQPRASQNDLSKGRGKPGDAREHHMDAAENIQNLAPGQIDHAVTSPPYEGIRQDGGAIAKELGDRGFVSYSGEDPSTWHTQRDQNNIGNLRATVGREAGETYWDAMRKVYASLFLALKPGGVAAIVVKDYVKDKQRVRLCDDTLRLLEHVGFVAIERAHAMLVEHSEHHDLFAGTVQTKKERKSFFRRLAEKKGSPPIDYEEVLFVRRPCASPS